MNKTPQRNSFKGNSKRSKSFGVWYANLQFSIDKYCHNRRPLQINKYLITNLITDLSPS